MMNISMILDILTVALLLICVAVGLHRGFIKSVVRLLGFAASVVLAAIASSPVAAWLFDNLFAAKLENFVTEKIQEGATSAAASLSEQVTRVLETLPESLQNLLTAYGMDTASLSGSAQSGDTLVATIMDQVLAPLCTAALQVIVFLVLFIVLFIVIRLIGNVLDKIFSSLPLIKQANGLLGAIFGFAEGVLLLFVLCYAIQLYMNFAGADSAISLQNLEQTRILSLVMSVTSSV